MSSKPYPPAAAWKALGKALELRRAQLGYPHGQRGAFADHRHWPMSGRTLARIERGEPFDYPESTLAEVERVYDLAPGAIWKFLITATEGDTAVLEVVEPKEEPGGTGDDLLDRIRRLPELTVAEKDAFVALAIGMRQTREAQERARREAARRQAGSRDRNGDPALSALNAG